MITGQQIKSIYVLASDLGINRNSHDDELHDLIYAMTGKESVKSLTKTEAADIISELMRRMKGSESIRKRPLKAIDVPPGKMSEAQQKKAWQLIYRLQEADPSPVTAAQRMKGAVKKILDMDLNTNNKAPFRMVTVSQGAKLIDMLKRYVRSAEKKAGG